MSFEPPSDPAALAAWQKDFLRELRKPRARRIHLDRARIERSVLSRLRAEQPRLLGEALAKGSWAAVDDRPLFNEFAGAVLDILGDLGLSASRAFLEGLGSRTDFLRTFVSAYVSKSPRRGASQLLLDAGRELVASTASATAREAGRRLLTACACEGTEEAFDLLDEEFHRHDRPDETLVSELLSGGIGLITSDADVQARANVVIALFDSLAKKGRFDRADEALRRLVRRQLPDEILITVLSATRSLRDKLPARAEFLERASDTLRARVPERAEKLIALVG